jgi:alkylation response protein AidB-like acyl-CoA dehydrogenase
MFEPDADQVALMEAAAASARGILEGSLREDDEQGVFRKEYIEALGEAGLCGVPTPAEWGGLGLGTMEYAMVLEKIAEVSASYAVSVAVTGLPQMILGKHGTPAQREAWLPGLASGQLLGAFALSEPGCGSDAAALTSRAERVEGGWLLNGTKLWITHGGVADITVVMARSGGPGAKGISAFLVPKGTPGLIAGKVESKMGMRASPTVELTLDQLRLPEDALIGEEGAGFRVAMEALDSGRITIAAVSVGLAQAAMEVAAKYATERRSFGQPIIEFQGVGFLLADMAMKIESARLLVHKAAWLKDNGRPFSHIAAMAKCMATDAAMAVTTDAVQVLGGYGYTRDFPVERYMRDAKVMQIVEGTNQIQRLVVSRHLGRTVSAG